MPNILTVKFAKTVGLVEQVNPHTGALYIEMFTPNEGGLEKANAGLGWLYITGATYTWEPEPVPTPDPVPVPTTSARYRVINPNGLNVRSGSNTGYSAIGSLASGQVVVIDNATKQGTRYLWGRLISIENPTPEQAAMMAREGEKWSAMKDGAIVWLEVIAEA